MAEWKIIGFTSDNDTSLSAGVEISSSSCLAFGGGTRSDFQSNIEINNWNTALHHADDTAESAVDLCAAPHLWPIYPTGTFDTGAVVDGTYVPMAEGTPHAARGINFRFRHDFGVKCSPAQIWAYDGYNTSNSPVNCEVAMADLTLADPTWATVSPENKLTCSAHTGSDESEHYWAIAMAVKPNTVGHNGKNDFKFEVTYY